MSQHLAKEPSKRGQLRQRLLRAARIQTTDTKIQEVAKATWRAFHPTGVALHVPQDPNPESNTTHRLLPHEHVESYAQREEREQQEAEERELRPAPLLFGPTPRRPTDYDLFTHEARGKQRQERDISELAPLERDVVSLLSNIQRCSCFRPMSDVKKEVLLVSKDDEASLRRVQDMARNLLADEKQNLCIGLYRFLTDHQRFVLEKLMSRSGIEIWTTTQGQKMDSAEKKGVKFAGTDEPLFSSFSQRKLGDPTPEQEKKTPSGFSQRPMEVPVPAQKRVPRNAIRQINERPTTENFFAYAMRLNRTPSPPQAPSRRSQTPPKRSGTPPLSPGGISISRSFSVTNEEMPENMKEELRRSQGSANSTVPDFLQNSRKVSVDNVTSSSRGRAPAVRPSYESAVPGPAYRASEDLRRARGLEAAYGAVPDFLANSRVDPNKPSCLRGGSSRPSTPLTEAVPQWLLNSVVEQEDEARPRPSCLRGGGDEEPESSRPSRTSSLFVQSIFTSKPIRPLPDDERLPTGLVYLSGSRVKEDDIMTAGEARDGRRQLREKQTSLWDKLFKKSKSPIVACTLSRRQSCRDLQRSLEVIPEAAEEAAPQEEPMKETQEPADAPAAEIIQEKSREPEEASPAEPSAENQASEHVAVEHDKREDKDQPITDTTLADEHPALLEQHRDADRAPKSEQESPSINERPEPSGADNQDQALNHEKVLSEEVKLLDSAAGADVAGDL